MIPSKLLIENFFGHSKSEIDFNEFKSAVIVGKNSNNPHISNGVGKSTIFKAIEYVLFNESTLKNIENIIRDGSDVSRVTFDFMIGNQSYRIVRSRSRKGSSDLRFYIQNGDSWDDLTQRRVSDTEKEISKLIKISYKTFKNSVLFSQNDFEGLAVLTPEKRKLLLKESLQLGNYSKLEALAKKRTQVIQREIDKSQTLIEALGDPSQDLIKIESDISSTELILTEKRISFEERIVFLKSIKAQTDALILENNKFKVTLDSLNSGLTQRKNFINSISFKKDQIFSRLNDLKSNLEKNFAEHKSLKEKFLDGKKNIPSLDKEVISNRINFISKEIIDITSTIKSNKSEIIKLNVPMPKDQVCNHCRSILTEEHRISCQKEISQSIKILNEENEKLQSNLNILNSEKEQLQNSIRDFEKSVKYLDEIKNKLLLKQKDIENSKIIFEDYKINFEKVKCELEEKNLEFSEVENERKSLDTKDYDDRLVEINLLNKEYFNNQNIAEYLNKEINELSSKLSVFKDRFLVKENDLLKIKTLKELLDSSEKEIIIHQNVVQAFGSAGIPALIIHNVLDDLQIQANSILEQIRPGLHLKFSVIKDGKNGEQDTLDIQYIINEQDREFEQLSGAQKLLITLSLRLSLSFVIQKALGIDIRLVLLDEVDQALDKAGVEAFFDAIKIIEKDFKVIIISHNEDLKDKFSHAILVEQDQSFISTASVVSSW